ncbi:hypothetical protein NOV72_02040 [Caballeronia novacaledonica]|uniref:Uncharacterized protein n=1 Tax=Caballeronia novacaledonica TaxID=1544861 RepID=A0A2U3I3T3_9BURK|nr:hypothetical protein [Caballeronia novacaledonica]SPB14809.1 hypothetical protein NOV72_02040 [Caballeronia novacaledonica]
MSYGQVMLLKHRKNRPEVLKQIMPLKKFHLRAPSVRGRSRSPLSMTLGRCRTAFRSILVDAAAGSVCDAVVHFDGIAAYQLFLADFQTSKNSLGLEA